MIRALLKKLRGVSKKRNLVDAPVPLEISNDELVTAYEWATFGEHFNEPLPLLTVLMVADTDHLVPATVVNTLRSLEPR